MLRTVTTMKQLLNSINNYSSLLYIDEPSVYNKIVDKFINDISKLNENIDKFDDNDEIFIKLIKIMKRTILKCVDLEYEGAVVRSFLNDLCFEEIDLTGKTISDNNIEYIDDVIGSGHIIKGMVCPVFKYQEYVIPGVVLMGEEE